MCLLIFLVFTILSLVAWVCFGNKLAKGAYVLMAFLIINIFGLAASICYYVGTSDWPLWIKFLILS